MNEWEQQKVFSVKKSKIKGKNQRSGFSFVLKEAEPEVISKPKKGFDRRLFHITHPIPQSLLFREIANNWPKIQLWLSRAEFSTDRIDASSVYERGIKDINFLKHRAKSALLGATSDWIVKTDITSFYPSIYTHSISWAAYGKENVKNNRNRYSGSLADRVDQLVRERLINRFGYAELSA